MLLFNWIGYRFVAHYLEQKADQSLEAKLDRNDYQESQLVEMRIPLNLPYLNDQPEFERVDGEVELNGQIYKYVKRKVVNGELVVLCVPNKDKMRLQTAKNDFFKLVNDLQHNNKGKKSENPTSYKNFLTEYKPEQNDWSIDLNRSNGHEYFTTESHLPDLFKSKTPGQPPEAC